MLTSLLLSSSCLLSVTADEVKETYDEKKFNFSGFARVVTGKLDEKHAEYRGYDSDISIRQQTLLGLQADYTFTDNISITAQVVAQNGDERESGIEWLYLTYAPTEAIKFKLGRQRTPFFNYSDIMDVGFAYPWINLPQQVYSSFFFSHFDGVLASYEFANKNILSSIEAYWGVFDDDIYIANQEVAADVDNLHGVIGNLSYGNWAFRSSFHQGTADVNLPQLASFQEQLNQFGFIESANSLRGDGTARFYQFSANYENIHYFIRSEITKVEADFLIVPNMESAFLSVGYNFYPFTTYLSFATNNNKYGEPVNEIPMGVSPVLDQLSLGYLSTFSQLPDDSSKSISIGARWDYQTNLAFKAEITRISGDNNARAFFNITNPQSFDQSAVLYQLAAEWVF